MRHIFFTILLFVSLFAVGQTTISPYSFYGPGELQNKGFSRANSMGGAGIALESGNHLNNLNPASYASIDSLRLIFEFGLSGKAYKLKSSSDDNSGFTGNFNYFALGFRYTSKWAGSIGLVPYSSVGYTVYSSDYVDGFESERLYRQYVGTGGISQAYFGNAFKIGKKLSLGLNASYLFGSLTQEENFIETDVVPAYQIVRQNYLKTFLFDFGLQYAFKFGEIDYSLGLTYSPQQSLRSRYIVSVYDDSYNYEEGDEYDTDDIKVPTKIGVGVKMQKSERLMLLIDYEFGKWSGLEYPNQRYDFEDSHRVALGTEFRPWAYRVINKGIKNWAYRAGFNYESSYLSYGGTPITKWSVSSGVGIPMPGRISYTNIGIEVGSQGRISLVKENFVIFHVGFNLNEVAFIKRKFD